MFESYHNKIEIKIIVNYYTINYDKTTVECKIMSHFIFSCWSLFTPFMKSAVSLRLDESQHRQFIPNHSIQYK